MRELGVTNHVDLKLSTRETNALQDLLDFYQETTVKDWTSELNVTEMTGAFCHSFLTRLTFEVSVDG
jgi:hypothetical protein